MGGRRDKGLVLGIRLHDPVEERVMVQADRVQQRSHWNKNQAEFWGAQVRVRTCFRRELSIPEPSWQNPRHGAE